MKSIKESLNDIVWYNGLYEFLQPLREKIINCNEWTYSPIFEPWYEDFLKESDQVQFLWMLLVLQYGDYGTSPRTGWVEMKNKEHIIKFIEDLSTLDGKYMWDKE
jgi:hypothetical protein